MKKRCFLFILLGTLCGKLFSQQIPVFSAYYINKFLVNPAFTGIDNQYRAFGFYRSQWGEISGRPVTGGADAEASFWKDRIGAGFIVANDQTGIFNRTNVDLSYAQKVQFSKEHQISIGVQGGIFMNRINFGNATVHDYNDPTVLQQNPSKTVFDFNLGIAYKWKALLVGFGIPNLIQPNSNYAEAGQVANYQYVRHYTAYAQYRFGISKNRFGITPIVFMRKGPATPFQFDGTALFDYKNTVFAGCGYRTSFGIIATCGVNIINTITIAYAFDYTTQPTLNGQVGASHEIIAGFHLPSNFKPKKHNADSNEKAEDNDKDASKLKKDYDAARARLAKANSRLDSMSRKNNELKQNNQQLNDRVDSLKKLLDKKVSVPVNQVPGQQGKEKEFTLDQIYFELEKYELLPQSKEQLDSLAAFLKAFPNVEIMIKGYTDNTGNEGANQVLSELRAKAVADYLQAWHIAAARISYRGFGSNFPVAGNDNEEGRKKNRRVEFVITKE